MVIENHPVLDDGSPFPTLYWLTCPILAARVSRLESEGAMNDLTERLGADPDLKERLSAAIVRYRELRDRHAVIDDKGSIPGGGPDRVKCLHAHTAYELAAGGDPVGALTLADTGWPDCIAPCVEIGR